jgi:hypothetical protein
MRINLSFSQVIEFIGVVILIVTTTAAMCAWFFQQFKEEILAECKKYCYVLQERIQGNEIELNHINNHAEKAWPRFQRLILSIRRRDIDEVR